MSDDSTFPLTFSQTFSSPDYFWFGDIAVGFVTDKDTDISKDITEKNFVDEPPQVYELTPDLESGTYSLILNQEVHPRSETLKEQRDAVMSMPQRHVSEFPVDIGGDKGYVLVESSNASITSSEMIDEAEASIRFLEDSDYKPAVQTTPQSIDSNFSVTPEESIISFPWIAENIQRDGSTPTKSFEMDGKDGTMEYYEYTQDTLFEYDAPDDRFAEVERLNPVRVFDAEISGSGTYGTDYGTDYGSVGGVSKIRRVYSNMYSFSDTASIDNGFLMSFPNGESGNEIYFYDAGNDSWKLLGEWEISNPGVGFIEDVGNFESTVDYVNSYSVEMYKGFPVAKFEFDGLSELKFKAENEWDALNDNGHYITFTDQFNNKIIWILTDNDGSWVQDDAFGEYWITRDNLDSSKEYSFYIGIVPSDLTADETARYMYNRGNIRRTMKQR